MIHIRVKQKQNKIVMIQVKGHAEYGEHGQDLVCAGVSSIMVGLLNVLDEEKKDVDMEMESGWILISVNDVEDLELQTILKVGYIQLKTMEESYSNYIGIEKEV